MISIILAYDLYHILEDMKSEILFGNYC